MVTSGESEETQLPSAEPEEATKAKTTLHKAVDDFYQAREEFVKRAVPQLETALNKYLRISAPKARNLKDAQELVKSVGELLRDLHVAIRGKGTDRSKPCALLVDFDSNYPTVPRFRLRLSTLTDDSNSPGKRYSNIGDRTFSYTLSSILPLELMPAPSRSLRLARWADTAVVKGRSDKDTGLVR